MGKNNVAEYKFCDIECEYDHFPAEISLFFSRAQHTI